MSVNFTPSYSAGTVTTKQVLFNADGNLEYMIPEAIIDAVMADASYFTRKDHFSGKFEVTENIYNKDVIQVIEVSLEWYETILPTTGRTLVAREISRRVVSEKVFKFSAKKGASWK